MQLKGTDTQSKNYRVFFNGRPAPYVIAASEEEGWIEVIDKTFIGMIAPITQTQSSGVDMSEPEPVQEFKTKRLYGKVELKLAPLKPVRE